MRNMVMADQQYQALVGRSAGPSSVSSQLLPPQGVQYASRKLYADRVGAVDPYDPAEGRLPSLAGSTVAYAPRNRADDYPDSQDIRAQLAAERRAALLPSTALVDYSPPRYVDHVGPRVLAGPRISPEVVGAYPGHYPSPSSQRAGQPLSNAEILAARARRTEIAASYPGGYANEARRIPPVSSYDEPSLMPGQAAGILGPGAARRGRELDRYLLSVQPEKVVRYAASVLAPDPVLRRSGHPMAGSNVNPEEDDRYSNYRRAKARRTGSHEFGVSEPASQRDRERGIYREREHYRERRGGGESERERGRRSPDKRQTNGSLSKGSDVNRLDRLNNTSQLSEEERGRRNGGRNTRSKPPETSGTLDKRAAPKANAENADSDTNSELGSLCAGLSDSDEEKVDKRSDDAATVIDVPLAGMIFGCSTATFHECMRLQLFGLPAKSKDDVMRVTPGTKVFLFNFDTKELSGIFEAISHGGWQLQPDAFRDFGGFPAQVQVCCSEQCPNITQSVFKPAIKENYVGPTRFKFDLNTKQVKDLVRMFRQAARNLPRQQDPLADRYLSARLQSEDYLASGGQQQRPYSRHPQARSGKSRVPYARVVSMSAKTNIRKSKRASKRALKRRKKRKVSNKPQSPMADNCNLYSLSGQIQEADVTINASGCDDDTSNTNNAVIVGEGIETGNSRNADQQKDIIEAPAAKGIAPSGPDHGLSPSKPEEFPQLQSNLGKQVSFLKDSCNHGNFRLAGSRADEQGQGLGLDVLQGALSSGNMIKSSDCTLSSMGEGLCSEVQGDFITTGPAKPLVNLGGNNVQNLASTTSGVRQLSALDEKSREGLGDFNVPAQDNSLADLDSPESISSEFGTGGKLPDVHMDEVLIETVEDQAHCKLSLVGKVEELEVSAAEVAVGHDAPCVGAGPMVGAKVVGKDPELDVTAPQLAIDSESPFLIKEVMSPAAVVGKVDELEVIAGEVSIDYEAPIFREEVMVVAEPVSKYEEFEVIPTDVAVDSETPHVREVVVTAPGDNVEDELDVPAAEVVVDSLTACFREKVMIAAGAVGKDKELEVIAAEVRVDSEDPVDREETMVADGAVDKDGELEVMAAGLAVDSEAPLVREEVMIATQALSSQFLASADMEDKVTFPDVNGQSEEIISAEALENEQPFPDLNGSHGDDEDEEEVLLAGNAVGGELDTSVDEDEDEVGKDQDYDCDEGDDEDEETVDVSVDGELSNLGEDRDEDEDIGEGVDDDASYDD